MYEYKVESPVRVNSRNASPIMEDIDIEDWLNNMDQKGWEFVGTGQKHWVGENGFVQTWWVFRKKHKVINEAEAQRRGALERHKNICGA